MNPDVVIIGAGAAGLAAARALSHAGVRCVLVEARPHLGGRVLTLRDTEWPVPVELGAEFLHGPSPQTRAIADAASLPIVSLPDRHAWAGRSGRHALHGFWSELHAVRRKIPTRGPDMSFAAFLASQKRLSPRLRTLARMFVEGYDAAPLDDVSAQSLAAGADESDTDQQRQYRLRDGQDGIVRWLHAGLDPERVTIWLNTVAETVAWRRGRVSVSCRTTPGGAALSLRGRALLVTAPISVLKATEGPGRLVFSPALPRLAAALEGLGMGQVQKLTLRFRHRLWDERTGFLHDPQAAFPTWWTQSPLLVPVITGWAGGPAARALVGAGEAAVLDAALATLARVLKRTRRVVESALDGWQRHDWASDPFSRGAYSYVRVGGLERQRALVRPFGGTIFIAGEATDPEETGTLNGALASGRRAARAIRRRLEAG